MRAHNIKLLVCDSNSFLSFLFKQKVVCEFYGKIILGDWNYNRVPSATRLFHHHHHHWQFVRASALSFLQVKSNCTKRHVSYDSKRGQERVRARKQQSNKIAWVRFISHTHTYKLQCIWIERSKSKKVFFFFFSLFTSSPIIKTCTGINAIWQPNKKFSIWYEQSVGIYVYANGKVDKD